MNAVDTNIFAYALDLSEPSKSATASRFLDSLSRTDTVLLWQVVCEFSATLLKLQMQGRCAIVPADAVAALRGRFPTVLPDPAILDAALVLRREHQVAFWDAMLLAGCAAAGVNQLFSEDLPGMPTLLGVRIINPLATN